MSRNGLTSSQENDQPHRDEQLPPNQEQTTKHHHTMLFNLNLTTLHIDLLRADKALSTWRR